MTEPPSLRAFPRPPSSSRLAGFSLLETMVAVAIVGFIGSGTALLLSHNAKAAAETRMRVTLAAESEAVLLRMISMADLSRVHGGSTTFCQAVVAGSGPMAGGTLTGTCPSSYSSADAVVENSSLKRTVSIVSTTIGEQQGYEITVSVSSPRMAAPVSVSSLIPRFGDE